MTDHENHHLHLTLASLEVTGQMGRSLGRVLRPGAVCLFFGEMAAGKTTLIKAICEGLGVNPEHVISPTYTLANVYPAQPPVCHVDLFRIEEPEALLEMDQADWLMPEGVTLIEWPHHALPLLEGMPCLILRLSHPAGQEQTTRLLEVEDPAGAYGEELAALQAIGRS